MFPHPVNEQADALDHVGGRFVARKGREIEVRSPADQGDVVARFSVEDGAVDEAVDAARASQRAFWRLGFEGRARLLYAYRDRLKAHAEEMAVTIAREIGKPLWEARAEVGAMVSKVDVSAGEGMRFVRDEVIADLPGEIRHVPHGVMAVVGPFNFPGHLPNGQIVPSLLAGNAVVFKPSERGPLTAAWMARCMAEAGVPAGVFNVVQGDAQIAERLVTHEGVDGVLFTGSVAVGRRILSLCAATPGRLVQLELGGKNASVVLDDAEVERASREVVFSAFATAGQRCTATSRLVVQRAVAERVIERVCALARGLVVGYPLGEGVFMGPVISAASRRGVIEAAARAEAAGFEALVRGGEVEVAGRAGFYLSPGVHLATGAGSCVPGYTDRELFGPELCVYVVDDEGEAVSIANSGGFGLSAAVYTASRERFERVADELRVGVVHHNRSTAGASGRLPFGGVGDSGNHRPAGVMMSASCAYPKAVLLSPAAAGPLPSWPGLAG